VHIHNNYRVILRQQHNVSQGALWCFDIGSFAKRVPGSFFAFQEQVVQWDLQSHELTRGTVHGWLCFEMHIASKRQLEEWWHMNGQACHLDHVLKLEQAQSLGGKLRLP
jgi:hypothetical protein